MLFRSPDPDVTTVARRPTITEGPGTTIGPYKLLQQIGEGGMGTVFMAEQERPVRRKVALKVIKPGMDTRQVLARFEAERQALAMMDHPNIAHVLDVGATEAGRPFFVMELVKGVPITHYCDQNKLTPKERLELFIPVCRAIQHAHQKGIIHRDIKPSNVLVALHDGVPVPKVIDFGVAKAIDQRLTERTMFTEFGAVVGTLEYMSPEQAEMGALDIDTRSDIYSLGVLLYELLTGSTPLERAKLCKAAYAEVLKRIREEEPTKPSTRLSESKDALPSISAQRKTEPARLAKLVRGDLDWIVMKSLEKDRTRRYETATGFARDIQRYLDGDAVEACPPSAGYRLRKLLHKHGRSVAAAATLFLALAIGIVGTTFGLLRAEAALGRAVAAESEARELARVAGEERNGKEQARREAVASAGAARAEAGKAEDARRRTREALDSLTGDVVTKLLSQGSKLGMKERAFLLRARGYFEEFARDQGDTDQARRDRARGLHRVANIRMKLGEERAAAGDLLVAESLLAGLTGGPHPLPADRLLMGEVRTLLSQILKDDAKRSEALALQRRIVEDFERFVAESPQSVEYRKSLATCQLNLGNELMLQGPAGEPEALYLAARGHLEKLEPGSQDLVIPLYLSSCYNNLAAIYAERRDFAAAEECLTKALRSRARLAAENPEDSIHQDYLARTEANLASVLFAVNRREEAEAHAGAAVGVREALVKAYPGLPAYRQDLAMLLSQHGDQLLEAGAAEAALARFDRAVEVVSVPVAPEMAKFMKNQERIARLGRASALDRLGRWDDAAREWDRSLDLADAPARPGLRLRRAGSFARAGRVDEAIREADATDKGATSSLLYDSACVFALVYARTKDEAHAARAVGRLREAVVAGWKDAAHTRQDDDLGSLRGREDFRGLLDEMAAVALRPSDLDARLAAVLDGRESPRDGSERLRLAYRAHEKSLYAASARLFAEALANEPKLADDRGAQHPYNAACVATLAGTGRGKDSPPPDAAAKAKLRRQARDWLRSELAAWTKALDAGPPEMRDQVAPTLKHWKVTDPDLAGIRDDAELAKLPEDERAAFKQLWADVDRLLARASAGK